MTLSRLGITSVALLLNATSLTGALAQQLPAGFEEQPSPNRATLATFADEVIEHLESGDPARVSQARQRVLERLDNPAVSVGFRLALTEQLTQRLSEIAMREPGLATTNALKIAGELGTSGSLDVIISALSSEHATTRFAAAVAAGATFEVADSPAPPLRERPVNQLIDALTDRITQDPDAEVVAGSMRGLLAARQVSRGPLIPQANRALIMLSQASGKRLAKLESEDTTPAHHQRMLVAAIGTGTGLREMLADVGRDVPVEVRQAAGELAGDALAHAYSVVRQDGLPRGQDRQIMVQLVDTAEKLVFFAGDGQGGSAGLADSMRSGDREQFIRGVLSVAGPGGQLTEAPFGFTDGRFLSGR